MATEILIKNDLFEKLNKLSQQLFYDPAKGGPTRKNPIEAASWQTYLDCCRHLNDQVPDGAKRVAVVVTKGMIFVKDEGFKSFYYHETIMASENYEKRLTDATEFDHVIIRIDRLIH